jgi:hypothetical protein
MSEESKGYDSGGKKYTLHPESTTTRVSVDGIRIDVGGEPVVLTEDQVSRVEAVDGVKLSEV